MGRPGIDQRDFLYKEKARLNVTWAALAEMIGVSVRRLYAWKLPKGSNGRRTMPEEFLFLVAGLSPYKFDQATYLASARSRLGCTSWSEFARITGLNQRALRNWLKDPDSSEFRNMVTADAQQIQSAIDTAQKDL
jgi:hypothetical protein